MQASAATWQQIHLRASGEQEGGLLEEADVYKATASENYVVLRRTQLFRDRFITYHSIETDRDNNKEWLLDPRCELLPHSAGDIGEPVTRLVRPPGQWAITSLVRSKGSHVTLVSQHTGGRQYGGPMITIVAAACRRALAAEPGAGCVGGWASGCAPECPWARGRARGADPQGLCWEVAV